MRGAEHVLGQVSGQRAAEEDEGDGEERSSKNESEEKCENGLLRRNVIESALYISSNWGGLIGGHISDVRLF